MIVLLACLFAAVFLVGMALGVWLARAANRRARGGTVDFTPFGGMDYWSPSATAAETVKFSHTSSSGPARYEIPPYDQEAGGDA